MSEHDDITDSLEYKLEKAKCDLENEKYNNKKKSQDTTFLFWWCVLGVLFSALVDHWGVDLYWGMPLAWWIAFISSRIISKHIVKLET